MKHRKMHCIQVALDDEQWAELCYVARERRWSRALVMREALALYLRAPMMPRDGASSSAASSPRVTGGPEASIPHDARTGQVTAPRRRPSARRGAVAERIGRLLDEVEQRLERERERLDEVEREVAE